MSQSAKTSFSISLGWLGFFLLMAFAFYGARPLWEPDEGRYAEASREMLVTGDWLIPKLQDQEHLTKPPLTYWLGATGLAIFGVNAWGARFSVSLAYFLTILYTYHLGRTWRWRRDEALAGALVFSTSVLPFAAGHIFTTDMILTSWMTLGTLCAWKVWTGAPRATLWRWGFWIAFALAFLTKGPPGWIPLFMIALFAWMRRSRRPAGRLWSPWAFIAFLALSVSWFAAVVLIRPELVKYFLYNEVYQRIFTSVHHRNRFFLIYVPTLILGLFPWIFLWPDLLKRPLQNLMPASCPRTLGWADMLRGIGRNLRAVPWFSGAYWVGWAKRAWSDVRGGLPWLDDVKVFSVLYVVPPFILFTCAKSRMFFYIVPLFVPIALWAGRLLVRLKPWWTAAPPSKRRLVAAAAAVWLAMLAIAVTYPDTGPASESHLTLSRQILAQFPAKNLRIYTDLKPISSISFYTGILLRERDMERHEIIPFLEEKRGGGTIPAMLTKRSRAEDLVSAGGRILLQDRSLALVGLP